MLHKPTTDNERHLQAAIVKNVDLFFYFRLKTIIIIEFNSVFNR